MTTETSTVIIRKLTASEGMVITDVETETMRAKVVYLGKEDSEANYKEIDENTPLPEALHMLGKRFNVDFIVKNTKLNANRFTGTFTTQRLEKILKYFEISSRIRWRYLNDPDVHQEKMRIEIY